MSLKHKNDGFTLVELLVTITIGSLITLAATTVLLLGLRLNKKSQDTIIEQNTTRIFLTLLENMASEGAIDGVKVTETKWEVLGGEKSLVTYDSEQNIIYAGTAEDAPLLTGVLDSSMELDGNGLLTFSVETENGTYTSSVFCRMAVDSSPDDNGAEDKVIQDLTDNNNDNDIVVDPLETTAKARSAFLKTLVSQYSLAGVYDNPGLILNNGLSTGIYYSQWYISDVFWNINDDGWDKDTPWCACYISWALSQVESDLAENPHAELRFRMRGNDAEYFWYANVDDFAAYIKSNSNGHRWEPSKANFTATGENTKEYTPLPGDLIFFDWYVDGTDDPQHVGVVLKVDGDYVHTIEGNSDGRVAVQKYALGDRRIMGYGVLKWVEQPANTQDET